MICIILPFIIFFWAAGSFLALIFVWHAALTLLVCSFLILPSILILYCFFRLLAAIYRGTKSVCPNVGGILGAIALVAIVYFGITIVHEDLYVGFL